MSDGDFKPLKLDHDALLRGRVLELERALDDVWGEMNVPLGLGLIEAGLVLWAARQGCGEPVKEARNVMVEAASLGLIVKTGGRWRRARRASSRRRGDDRTRD